jgi:hypothetical protein
MRYDVSSQSSSKDIGLPNFRIELTYPTCAVISVRDALSTCES